MDVDTRLLRYFAAEGNLTRAAERLFVSQPALTKQVKQLESQLGVRLTEPRWVVLPAAHPLAARDQILFRQDFVRCCLDNKPPAPGNLT